MEPVVDLWERLAALSERSPAYRREAYEFVLGALERAILRAGKRRHVTGQELLAGAVELARAEFGDLALTVFSEWGVRSSEDLGRIVFALVEDGLLSRREEDSIEDFKGGIDLVAALAPPPRASHRT